MYKVGFKYAENDIDMSLKIDEFFEKSTKMKSKPCDGMDTVLAIVTIAGFTLEFAKFVIDYIIKLSIEKNKNKKKDEQSVEEKSISTTRCIVYNGKTITPSLLSTKLDGKECTPENILEIICEEFQL